MQRPRAAIDTDAAKVESLSLGVPPIYEPGLGELLASVLPTGRLRFTTNYAEAAGADVHFICVGTPQRKGDLRPIRPTCSRRASPWHRT